MQYTRLLSIRRFGSNSEIRKRLLDGIVAKDGLYVFANGIRYRIKWDLFPLQPGDRVRFVPRATKWRGEHWVLELETVNGVGLGL